MIADLKDEDGDDEPSEVTLVTGGQRVRVRAQQGSRPEIQIDPATESEMAPATKKHGPKTVVAALIALAAAIGALVEALKAAGVLPR
jgi:hypothetical protein